MRKNKIDRDGNRDVSEKIALGMHKGSGQLTGEAMYDARLFNQSSGMDSGFGAEDEYNTYSKPLFDRQEASSLYRPKRDDGDMFGDVDKQVRCHLLAFLRIVHISAIMYFRWKSLQTRHASRRTRGSKELKVAQGLVVDRNLYRYELTLILHILKLR